MTNFQKYLQECNDVTFDLDAVMVKLRELGFTGPAIDIEHCLKKMEILIKDPESMKSGFKASYLSDNVETFIKGGAV